MISSLAETAWSIATKVSLWDMNLDSKVAQKCNWQSIVNMLRSNDVPPWLTDRPELKYGVK
jgi:hypothetical protein